VDLAGRLQGQLLAERGVICGAVREANAFGLSQWQVYDLEPRIVMLGHFGY